MVGHGHAYPLEVVGTMIEMADVAWNALEHRRERKVFAACDDDERISQLRLENEQLKGMLEENLEILKSIAKDSSFSKDCPPDLYARLEAVVHSSSFLAKLDSLNQESSILNANYPSLEDLKVVDVSVDIDNGEPGRWVLVTKDMLADNVEEVSGIDKENYVIISEKNVVDGIADFIAKCVYENPKSKVLTPEEMQRTVTMVLGGIKDRSKLRYVWEAGKVIYTLSTWGICLAGLYRGRAVLKAAAIGVSATSRIVLKAL